MDRLTHHSVRPRLLFEFALLAHRNVVLSLDRGGEGAGEYDAHDAEGKLHVDDGDDGRGVTA